MQPPEKNSSAQLVPLIEGKQKSYVSGLESNRACQPVLPLFRDGMLSVALLARAKQNEIMPEGYKGPLVAIPAARRQAQKQQMRKIRHSKTRDAKIRKAANTA
jgi:hypothetical protein